MIAAPRQTRHFTSGTARNHRTHLDDVVRIEFGVAGHENAVADHQVRLTRQVEFGEQRVHPTATDDLDLAALVGADLSVMARDAKKMRGVRPFLFSNLKENKGVDDIAAFIVRQGGLPARQLPR